MAFIRKIKASLVRQDVEDYIGEETYLFYDIETGCLRQYDGTPGGIPACIEGLGTSGISTVQDEGIDVSTAATLLNFAGAGVTATEPGAAGEITVTIPGGSITGLTTTIINGQPMLTLEDTTRANKILSVSEQELTWSDNKVNNNDWLLIGKAKGKEVGYIADFDGTIVYASAYCKDTKANSKEIRIYIDGANSGSVGTLSGGTEITITNTTLDLDFTQGQKLRLQAIDGSGGDIKEVIVKLTIKWRG